MLVAGFDLDAIASLGSVVALLVFSTVSVAHLRVFRQTGANPAVLGLGLATALVVLVTFVVTELVHDLPSLVALLVIVALSAALDAGWRRRRARVATS